MHSIVIVPAPSETLFAPVFPCPCDLLLLGDFADTRLLEIMRVGHHQIIDASKITLIRVSRYDASVYATCVGFQMSLSLPA